MPLLQVVGTLILIGVLLWAVNTFAAKYIAASILKIINVVVVVAVVLWLLGLFGLWGSLSTVRVGK